MSINKIRNTQENGTHTSSLFRMLERTVKYRFDGEDKFLSKIREKITLTLGVALIC